MTKPYIFNIQKFSVHDGPGIRTTIFFKGCPLRCAWCHNPESQTYEAEKMETSDGDIEIIGKQYSIDELVKEIQKDQIFYDQSGGGVTLSGGECLSQNAEYIYTLVKRLYHLGISVAIDTCGVVSYERIKNILPYVRIFLYDLKFIDSQLHKQYTQVSNTLVLENLKQLSSDGANINLRLIMLEGINTDENSIESLIQWLLCEKINIASINLLPYHAYGRDKYRRLQREYEESKFITPSDECMEKIRKKFIKNGFKVAIGGSEINKIS